MKRNLDKKIEIDSMGKRLKVWRKSIPLTLVELGKEIDISQSSLSELENEKSLPSAGTLRSLCLRTKMNIYWLLTGQGTMNREVASPDDLKGLPEDFSALMQDHQLRYLVGSLIRIYQSGDTTKRSLIYGFLYGADPRGQG